MELAVVLAIFVACGVVRPRWTSILAASAPTALAFAWMLMHEDIPGESLKPIDLVWYAGMSLLVGAICAPATTAGIALGRAARRSPGPLSRLRQMR